MTRALVVGFTVALLVLVAMPGCGSRGPLDITVVQEISTDASVDGSAGDGASTDGTPGADADATPEDATADSAPHDTGSDTMTGPLSCFQCIQQQCGADVAMCLQDTKCRAALQCVVTMCLAGGGGINPQCALMCTNGDVGVLQTLFNVVMCIGGTCGQQCAGILPGGGGG